MMPFRILTRYVARAFLVPFLYCLVGFLSIYVLFELFGSFSRLMDGSLDFATTALYFAAYVAPFFHYIAPAALMLATLYTMWEFCRHSEIVAMRASGIGLMTIVLPVLSLAVLTAVGVAWVNESFVPQYAGWASQLKKERFDAGKLKTADNIVLRAATTHRLWNIDALVTPDATVLTNVRVTVDNATDSQRAKTIEAPLAYFIENEWWFRDARVRHYDSLGQKMASPTPELDALKLRCFAELTETPSDIVLQNRPWRFCSLTDRFQYLRTHPELSARDRNDRLYDIFSQMLAPLACLIITLFSIPAGIASGRQSVFRGILGALGLYFGFYALIIGGMVVSKNDLLPPLVGAGLPHLLFLAMGLRALWRQR